MRKIILFVCFMMVCGVAQANCTFEIKDVRKDLVRGSIIVETEYTLNGVVVQAQGRTRYLNESGIDADIIKEARRSARKHCKNLIKRIASNTDFIISEKLKRLESLRENRTSDGIIQNIKDTLIGNTESQTEVIIDFRGKRLNVKADGNNTVTDIP